METYYKVTKKVVTYKDACKKSNELRIQGKIVGFATGIFDVLHLGHAGFLKSIKDLTDYLFVGVDDNKTAAYIKGPGRPYFDETERAELLAALEFVDYSFIFKGPCSAKILSELRPTIYGVSPFDPNLKAKEKDARAVGTRILLTPAQLKSHSSTQVGRAMRFDYLLSRNTEPIRKEWKELRKEES